MFATDLSNLRGILAGPVLLMGRDHSPMQSYPLVPSLSVSLVTIDGRALDVGER